MTADGIKTIWYCLKTYNGKFVRYLPQEYVEHNRSWMDKDFICKDESECRSRCAELNSK